MAAQYPKNHLAQVAISALEHYKIKHIVLCPGSRNAPLMIGFTAIKNFFCYSLVDERSAGFVALGMAQALREPVALVCTSGSALANFYPAVVEAFYNQIPLIIISADRPAYMIDIGEGQCIHQKNIFGKHCIMSRALTPSKNPYHKSNLKKVSQLIHTCILKNLPVHLNVPFEEPLYETQKHRLNIPFKTYPNKQKIISKFYEKWTQKKYQYIWKRAAKIMILLGTMPASEKLSKQLAYLVKHDSRVLVLCEATSNLYHSDFILHIDMLLAGTFAAKQESLLCPDLLITAGGNIVSKKIKQFLRTHTPKHHWHVDKHHKRDTFFCLTQHIQCDINLFFESHHFSCKKNTNSPYPKKIRNLQKIAIKKRTAYLKKLPLCDLKVFQIIHQHFPKGAVLHLSNSSVVRYAQFFTWKKAQGVYANRGVAGIEGSISTAVGHSMVSDRLHFLIAGDLSFFYDSNALWNTYLKNNLRIVLINNGGGGIFNILPEPSKTNCLDCFTTPHFLTAQQLCTMHEINYCASENLETLQENFLSFLRPTKKKPIVRD